MASENKLYNALSSSGFYTKPQSDFESQFATPEAQSRLYNKLRESEYYTKDENSFKQQFFTPTENIEVNQPTTESLETTPQAEENAVTESTAKPSVNIPMFGNVTPQQMGTPAPPISEEIQGKPNVNIPMFGNVTPQQMATAPTMPSTFKGQDNAVEEVKPVENKGIFEQGVSKVEDALKIVPQIETDIKTLNEAPSYNEAGAYYNKRRKELADEYKNEVNKDIVKKSTIDKDKVGFNTFLNLTMSGLGLKNDEEEKVYSNSDSVKERLDKFDAEAKKVLNKRKAELSTLTDYDTDNLEGLIKTPDRADHQAINDYLDVIAATDPLKATDKSKSITENSLPSRDKYNITMQGYDMALQKLDNQFQPLYEEQQKLENSEALKTSMALQKEYKPLYEEQQKLENSDLIKNAMQLPKEQALQIPEVKKYLDLTNQLNSKVQKINQIIQTPEVKRYAELSNELNKKGQQFKNLQTLREGVSKRYNYEPPKEGDEGIWGNEPNAFIRMANKQVARTAGGLGKTILTLGSLPQAYLSRNEDNLRRTNDMLVSYDDALDRYVPILKDERVKQQDGSTLITPKALYGEMLNGVGQLIEFAAPGMAFEKAALTLGGAAMKGTGSMALASLGEAAKPAVETISNYAGIMSSTMDDYTQEGFEKGLRGKELAAYATSHSLVEAATESFLSPESILKGAVKGFTKLGSEGVAKAIAGAATKQALKQGAKEGLKTIAGETGEEVTSAVLHNFLNSNAFNVNNDQDLKEEIKDALIVTPISMIPMALMGSLPRTHLTKIQSIYQAGQDPQHYKDIAEKMLASGKFTPEQANSVITTANAMSEIIKANPTLKQMNEWDAPQKAYAIYSNQLLKQELKNENLLPETIEQIKGKIKDNDAIISGAVKMSKELGYERPIDKLPQAEQKVAISLYNELQRMMARYEGKVDESKPLADQISPEDMKRVDEIHNQLMSLKNKYFKPTIEIDNSANEPAATGATATTSTSEPFELDLNIPTTATPTEATPAKKPSLSESILGELNPQAEEPKVEEVKAETPPIEETPQAGSGGVGDVEAKRIETEAKIKRKDLFSDGGIFANELGGSGVNSVPTNHSERNGIEFVQFSNPNTGIVDVIMSGKSDNDFVGYYRIYENGKATNKWSSKFENQSRNKEDFKTMISGVQEMLPQGHEYTEKTSISTDGLRVWNQQLSRGYELQYDSKGNLITNRVAINGDAINNELGIAVNKGNFENVSVTNNTDMKKVKEALLPYLQKFGLNESNIHFENGTVEIDLPVLKNKKAVEIVNTPTPATKGTTETKTSKPATEYFENQNRLFEVTKDGNFMMGGDLHKSPQIQKDNNGNIYVVSDLYGEQIEIKGQLAENIAYKLTLHKLESMSEQEAQALLGEVTTDQEIQNIIKENETKNSERAAQGITQKGVNTPITKEEKELIESVRRIDEDVKAAQELIYEQLQIPNSGVIEYAKPKSDKKEAYTVSQKNGKYVVKLNGNYVRSEVVKNNVIELFKKNQEIKGEEAYNLAHNQLEDLKKEIHNENGFEYTPQYKGEKQAQVETTTEAPAKQPIAETPVVEMPVAEMPVAETPSETTITEPAEKTLANALNEVKSLPRKAQIKKATNKLIDKHFENIFAQLTLKEPNKYKRIC